MNEAESEWFAETLHEHYRQQFRVSRVVHRERTGLQEVLIFENPMFGRVLALDGVIQTTEADEHVYHEMIAHVPIFAHPAPRSVLIIGGGDGGALEEVLKHRVEKVTLVDIDRGVIELSRKHLRCICGDAFEDARVDVVIADGRKHVATCEERYDVIVVDSTDPIGPGEALYSAEFYAGCRRALAAGGVVVTQNGCPFLQEEEVRDSYARLGGLFGDVTFYTAAVPTYVGGVMAFGWATEDASLRKTSLETIARRYSEAAIPTRYYTPEVHVAAFALPRFVAEALSR
jgi:spermidine synthase